MQAMDSYLLEAMTAYDVPVASYALIDDFKIIKTDTLSIDSTMKVNNFCRP